MNTNRRSFLARLGGMSAGALAGSLALQQAVLRSNAQETAIGGAKPIRKNYVTSRCLFELEGAPCGWIWSAEGGVATADVTETRSRDAATVKKQLGQPKFEDLVLVCGAGLSQPFYAWIKSFIAGSAPARSGAIIYFDSAGSEISRLSFTNARIAEVAFPALDATSEDTAAMTVRLTPESTRRTRDRAGRIVTFDAAMGPRWPVNHFRLSLDGLAETAARTLWIDGIVAKARSPSGLDISDLVLTFPSAAATPIEQWFDEFVLKGNHSDAMEKSGRLEFLSPDQPGPLFTLSFEHLGIFRLEPAVFDTGTRMLHPVQARMYCEAMRFDAGPATS